MTCIVGLVQDGTVYIGADTAGVSGYDFTNRKDKKVFIRENFIIGFTSSFRMGQILRYHLYIKKIYKNEDVFSYMIKSFIPYVISSFKENEFIKKENECIYGGIFLVGVKGRLFQIESDFQVGESELNFDSIGCGSPYALGSLYSTRNNEKYLKNPKLRIEEALKAAAKFSAGVSENFYIYSVSE